MTHLRNCHFTFFNALSYTLSVFFFKTAKRRNWQIISFRWLNNGKELRRKKKSSKDHLKLQKCQINNGKKVKMLIGEAIYVPFHVLFVFFRETYKKWVFSSNSKKFTIKIVWFTNVLKNFSHFVKVSRFFDIKGNYLKFFMWGF